MDVLCLVGDVTAYRIRCLACIQLSRLLIVCAGNLPSHVFSSFILFGNSLTNCLAINFFDSVSFILKNHFFCFTSLTSSKIVKGLRRHYKDAIKVTKKE